MKDLDLNTDFLIGIGMDGPSVNKSFERKLISKLEKEKGNIFFSIGSCCLHTVNNAFGAGMTDISEYLDIEQFLTDVFFSSRTPQQEEKTTNQCQNSLM